MVNERLLHKVWESDILVTGFHSGFIKGLAGYMNSTTPKYFATDGLSIKSRTLWKKNDMVAYIA